MSLRELVVCKKGFEINEINVPVCFGFLGFVVALNQMCQLITKSVTLMI